MDGAPDISKVVGVLMEHPDLMERITSLIGKGSEDESAPSEIQPIEEATRIEENAQPTAASTSDDEARRRNRARLLGAMKPYLSENRTRAIDTMIGIADALDILKRR